MPYVIGVVIPYYQVESGILRRCLSSVAAQTVTAQVLVVVVDDQSPCPAEDELASLALPGNVEVVSFRQANAGPGAARNAGIEYVLKSGVNLISFLDSDDVWGPHHLEFSLSAFAAGFNLYASNWLLTSGLGTGFESKSMLFEDLKPVAQDCAFAALPVSLVEQEMQASIVKLSCLVLDAHLLGNIRFDGDLRYASEDRLFVLMLAMENPKVALSFSVGVRAGRGVNVYESVTFGTRRNFLTLRDQLLGRRKMHVLLRSNRCASWVLSMLDAEIVGIEKQIARNFNACIRRGDFRAVFDFFPFVPIAPSVMVYVLSENLRSVFKAIARRVT